MSELKTEKYHLIQRFMRVFHKVTLVVAQHMAHELYGYIGNCVVRRVHILLPKASRKELIGDKNDTVRKNRGG